MATNKHAIIRFQALDKCFQNRFRKFYIEDLVKACCDALLNHCGILDGVKKRQVFDDINFMMSEEGYSIPLDKIKEGKRICYRYSDPDYSINKQQISPQEIERLKETVQMLGRFKGLPNFEWMEEVLVRLEGAFRLKSNAEGIVSFEQNPYLKGLEHFDGLFHAIINKQVLSISYQASFGKTREYTMHPYHLKQYNSRWFLFGLAGGRIMTMAIDRIGEFQVITVPYIENTDTDFDEYFDDVVGVTVPQSKEAEQIILKVDKERYNYIESKPVHPTQKVIARSEEQVTIGLKLIPFTLNDKRNPVEENDIPDIIARFANPDAELSRTRTDQSFMVPVSEIREQGYDLSINKYKEVVYEAKVYDHPEVILNRLSDLDREISALTGELASLLKKGAANE